ncbi:MAG: hypothetical protein COV76_03205 [Candidatus Omnitrophica bacterium CG11_big_fil_rev_8_21_14_0_20_64_10]|nr:MAG: hypothetical protein COV76_03205 [Candidatus Omnitrophica bacterium CG11_big_fil_rev_8_21_14_0_20_64_10]
MSYKVRLPIFEGPLDLLLHLVRQNHLEITTISLAQVTDTFVKTLELMQQLDLEVAGEFIVVAATLVQIKSRALLPPAETPAEEEENDPALELIERLKEYQRYKLVAEQLGQMEQFRTTQVTRPGASHEAPGEVDEYVEASLFDLLNAFSDFMGEELARARIHEILKDEFTVEDRVRHLKELTATRPQVNLSELFRSARSRGEIVATFLALLELLRQKWVTVRQSGLFGEIVVERSEGNVLTREESDGMG